MKCGARMSGSTENRFNLFLTCKKIRAFECGVVWGSVYERNKRISGWDKCVYDIWRFNVYINSHICGWWFRLHLFPVQTRSLIDGCMKFWINETMLNIFSVAKLQKQFNFVTIFYIDTLSISMRPSRRVTFAKAILTWKNNRPLHFASMLIYSGLATHGDT